MAEPLQVAAENVAAVNAHDANRLRATYAEDAVLEAPGSVRLDRADDVIEYVMVWLRAFPDARQTIVNQLVAGDCVVQEFVMTGTHTGTLASPDGDIPPTNRQASARGVQIQRIADDKVIEEHVYFDQLELLTQIGLIPAAAAA